MPVPLPHTFATKTILSGTELDENFTALANKFNGGIVASDVSATAGFTTASMSASYQKMVVGLVVTDTDIAAGGWPAPAAVTPIVPLASVQVNGLNTEDSWRAVSYSWVCTDTGDGLAQFSLQWGYYATADNPAGAAPGNWNNVATPIAVGTIANGGVANGIWQGSGNCAAGANMPFQAARQCMLRLVSVTASATTLTTAPSFFSLSVMLSRQIQAT